MYHHRITNEDSGEERCPHRMIYLASPYSHPDPAVREQRYRDALQATALLIRAGHVVFSPIVHSHPLVAFGLPTTWHAWESFDRAFIERSTEVVVLMLDGWRESTGVRAEIALARGLGKPVRFLGVDAARGSPTFSPVAFEGEG